MFKILPNVFRLGLDLLLQPIFSLFEVSLSLEVQHFELGEVRQLLGPLVALLDRRLGIGVAHSGILDLKL